MKIITMLLLMISTQAVATDEFTSLDFEIAAEQCLDRSWWKEKTVKAAISGVPIDEVINKIREKNAAGVPPEYRMGMSLS